MSDPVFRKSKWRGFRWGARGEPRTLDEYFNQPPWQRDRGGTLSTGDDATLTLPESDPDGPPKTVTVEADPAKPYTIEVYDQSNSLLREVTDHWGGKLEMIEDEASSLSFIISAESADVPDLAPPNLIWLRDQWGMLIDKFRIRKPKRKRSKDRTEYHVNAISAIAGLAKEQILRYTTGYDSNLSPVNKTVETIVSELLQNQDQSPAVSVGDIDPAIGDQTIALDMTDTTILAALRKVRALLPKESRGFFWLDVDDRLNWDVSFSPVKTLKVGEHVQNLDYEIDYETMATRLYMYGAGQSPDGRITLKSPGADQSEEYIEDSAAVSQWGVIPLKKIDKRIKHPATLLTTAQRILEEISQPVITVNLTRVIDLSKAQTPGYGPENYPDIWPGTKYDVIDTPQGLNERVYVSEITYSLENPLTVRLKLKNRKEDLGSIFSSILDQLYAPFDILDDGSLYPNVARVFEPGFSGPPGLGFRNADLRKGADCLEYYDEDAGEWKCTGGGALSEQDPEPVGGAPVSGDSEEVAPINHVHGYERVATAGMPSIPSEPKIIWHDNTGQYWGAGPGDSKWRPMMDFTNHSGT